MNNNPVQPTDKLIDEVAKRVAYKALLALEKEMDKAASPQPGQAANYEKMDTLGGVIAASCSAMVDPDALRSTAGFGDD